MDFSERQLQIMQESIELIAEKGIQGFTIKNLASKINLSEPAIYRHFLNKNEILIGIINYFHQTVADIMCQNEYSNPHESFKYNFLKVLKYFNNNKSIVSVVFSEEIFHHQENLRTLVNTLFVNSKEFMTNSIHEAQKNNIIRKDIDADVIAILILGMLRILIIEWRLNNYEFDLCERGLKIVENFEKMIQ